MLSRIPRNLLYTTRVPALLVQHTRASALSSRIYRGGLASEAALSTRGYSIDANSDPVWNKAKSVFLKVKVASDFRKRFPNELSLSRVPDIFDMIRALPNLATRNEREVAQVFFSMVLNDSDLRINWHNRELLVSACYLLDFESVQDPELVVQLFSFWLSHQRMEFFLHSYQDIMNNPEISLFRCCLHKVSDNQLQELSFLALKHLHPDAAVQMLSHFKIYQIPDAEFQQKIVHALIASWNRNSTSGAPTPYPKYFNEQSYDRQTRETLALALAKHRPKNLAECLQALALMEEGQPSLEDICFREKLAKEIVRANTSDLVPCFTYLQIDKLEDKDIVLQVAELAYCRELKKELSPFFIQDITLLRECIFIALVGKLCDEEKVKLLKLFQLEKIQDATLLEDIALYLFSRVHSGIDLFMERLKHPELETDPLLKFFGELGIHLGDSFRLKALRKQLANGLCENVAAYLRKDRRLFSRIDEVLVDDFSCENKQLLTKKILGYRNEKMALSVFTHFLQQESIINSQEGQRYFKAFAAICKAPKPKKQLTFVVHTLLPAATLAAWMAADHIDRPPSEIVRFLQEYRSELRNELKPLLSCFLLTIEALEKVPSEGAWSKLSGDQKLKLLSYACDPKYERENMQAMVKKLSFLSASANLSPDTFSSSILEKMQQGIEPMQGLYEVFQDALGAFCDFSDLSVEEALEGYEKTFGSMRYTNALGIYISTIPQKEDKTQIRAFIHDVITGTWKENGYKVEGNDHLALIKTNAPSVFAAWKFLQMEISATSSEKVEEKQFSLRSFLEDKLAHKHWHIEGQDKLPGLTLFLQSGQKLGESTGSRIEIGLIELLESEVSPFSDIYLEKLQEILYLCSEQKLELGNDIKTLLVAKEKVSETLKVAFTTHWQDMMLIGTEVDGSCQRISGSYPLNKCLFAYCRDRKIGAIILRHPVTEKIVARSMMRLLWNPKAKWPALFLSRLYEAHNAPSNAWKEIIRGAILCSEQISCVLFLPFPTEYTASAPTRLESKSSSFPHEYVDEAEGDKIVSFGKYHVLGYEVFVDKWHSFQKIS